MSFRDLVQQVVYDGVPVSQAVCEASSDSGASSARRVRDAIIRRELGGQEPLPGMPLIRRALPPCRSCLGRGIDLAGRECEACEGTGRKVGSQDLLDSAIDALWAPVNFWVHHGAPGDKEAVLAAWSAGCG
jgi:DnaJ-class molecular chaperone